MTGKNSTAKHKSKLLHVGVAIVLLPLASCLTFTTHQGNVLKPTKLAAIHINDSRFHVESLLGTPMLKDDMRPKQAIYVEDFNDPDTGQQYLRRVEIIYSKSGRVKGIKRFGFSSKKTTKGE